MDILSGSINDLSVNLIHYIKNFLDVINFGSLKSPKIITSEIFCIRKFKCMKFFKHYFSNENLHTKQLKLN